MKTYYMATTTNGSFRFYDDAMNVIPLFAGVPAYHTHAEAIALFKQAYPDVKVVNMATRKMFAVDVFGTPMRQTEGDKWEVAIWGDEYAKELAKINEINEDNARALGNVLGQLYVCENERRVAKNLPPLEGGFGTWALGVLKSRYDINDNNIRYMCETHRGSDAMTYLKALLTSGALHHHAVRYAD